MIGTPATQAVPTQAVPTQVGVLQVGTAQVNGPPASPYDADVLILALYRAM
jgi:hypothetical protein